MERKNSKQLRLEAEVGELAEQVHRDYQSAFRTSVSFCAFGNMVMRDGLSDIAMAIKNNQKRKRRKING